MENHLMRQNKGSCTADLLPRNRKKSADREKRWRNRIKKENLVQKAQQLENGSASWVGKLCVVRVYLFMHRQRARSVARACFRVDVPRVDGPLSLIKKMAGLINQHTAPSRVAAGSVTCPPNAALQSCPPHARTPIAVEES